MISEHIRSIYSNEVELVMDISHDMKFDDISKCIDWIIIERLLIRI